MYLLQEKETTFNYFKKIPKTRCVFITIRDPKGRYTLNKVKDWIKKSVSAMTIVRSPQGGEHFHMLCALLPKITWSPRCSKGIHFDIKYLNDKKKNPLTTPSAEEIQDSLMWKDVFERTRKNIMLRLAIRYPGCSIHFAIAEMVRDHHRRSHDRAKRLEARSTHEKHVLKVLDYLEKNLNENDFTETSPREYVHYYVKIP